MGSVASHNVCCSVRDKNERDLPGLASTGSIGQFSCSEVELQLDALRFLAFAPLWRKDGPHVRRLALANESVVHVYRLEEAAPAEDSARPPLPSAVAGTPQFSLEHSLSVGPQQRVTRLIFCNDMDSKHLAVAFAPATAAGKTCAGPGIVRVWNLDQLQSEMRGPVVGAKAWALDEGFTVTLEDHQTAVTGLAVSPTYLFTADAQGECGVWQKTTGFARRAMARLHPGGIGDFAVDRLFVYSTGLEECKVGIWAVPDLNPLLSIDVDLPLDTLPDRPFDGHLAGVERVPAAVSLALPEPAPEPQASCRLVRLTALRLPLSRWAGSQGSSRNGKRPKGSLFIAGVLLDERGGEAPPSGAGVLMHWMLGEEFTCKSAQVAHELPIVALAYGPYDNGPVITMDAASTCRVWIWANGLVCSQSVEFPRPDLDAGLAVAVEPHFGLFSTFGDRRIVIWHRDGEPC